MKTVERIGRGRQKVVASYLIRTDAETKYGKLKEIHVFWLRRKGEYITEAGFLIDDGTEYIQKKIFLNEKFHHVVKELENNTMNILRELGLV